MLGTQPMWSSIVSNLDTPEKELVLTPRLDGVLGVYLFVVAIVWLDGLCVSLESLPQPLLSQGYHLCSLSPWAAWQQDTTERWQHDNGNNISIFLAGLLMTESDRVREVKCLPFASMIPDCTLFNTGLGQARQS